MVGSKVAGDFGSLVTLINCIGTILKPHRKSLYMLAALARHEGHDKRGIDTTGEKRADRHIRNHLKPDRFCQRRTEPLNLFRICQLTKTGNAIKPPACRSS